MNLEKKDYAILHTLMASECFSKLRSVTITEMSLEMKSNTVYKKIQEMRVQGYISLGVKDGKANTYYITEKGIKFLEEALK